jgi:hypothetical protein
MWRNARIAGSVIMNVAVSARAPAWSDRRTFVEVELAP